MTKKKKTSKLKNFIIQISRIAIQTNDLFGVHANDNSTTIGERISIGLVAKFTFSGISMDKK